VLTPLGSKARGEFDNGSPPSLDSGTNANPNTSGPGSTQPHHARGNSQESAAIFVSAGEQLTVTDHATSTPEHADIALATAWVQHRLVFDASRLSDVVDNFNRYNTRQLVIEDRVLDDFHVSGVYSSTDPASLVRFLRSQPGVGIIETDKEVRITRK
jgi:transmembrane sensor